MPTTFRYYTKDNMVQVLDGATYAGIGAIVNAFESAVFQYLDAQRALGVANTALKFALKLGQGSGATMETINVIFNEDETFSIEGYQNGATFGFTQFAMGSAMTGALWLMTSGSPITILGAIGVASLSSLTLSGLEGYINWDEGLGLSADLQFLDQNGELQSGVFYPDGLDGTSNEHDNAVLNFISQAGHEIENGGKIEIDAALLDLNTWDSEYTLYNGNFIKDLVPFTDTSHAILGLTDIEAFLLYGNNLNVHAFKETYADGLDAQGNFIQYDDHYFFFEDNEVELSIPVYIGEALQVIEVNNVIRGDVLQMGDGSGKNVIYPNTAGIVSSTSDDDLILSATNVSAGDGDDTIIGTSGNDVIYGGDDEDIIDGRDGNDLLFGGDDDDTLHGWYGHDTLEGGGGNNQLNGGADYDWVDYRFADSLFGSNLTVNLTNTVTIDYVGFPDKSDVLTSIEAIILGNGDHLVDGNSANNIIMSGSGDDSINGYKGHDEIQGGDGTDSIWGGNGRDVLYGQGQNDTLYGDAHSDALIGGAGDDWLYGGNNSDVYWFGVADGEDTIVDEHGADRILLFDEQVLMTGFAAANTVQGSSWEYVLTFGDTLQGGQTYTALLDWEGDPLVAGSRGDLWIDFDNTNIYDIVIQDYMNGEFGIELAGAVLHPWTDPDNDNIPLTQKHAA